MNKCGAGTSRDCASKSETGQDAGPGTDYEENYARKGFRDPM